MSRRLRHVRVRGPAGGAAGGRTDGRSLGGGPPPARMTICRPRSTSSSTARSNGATTCDGPRDRRQDWMVLRSKARHSYEARVSSGSTSLEYGNVLDLSRLRSRASATGSRRAHLGARGRRDHRLRRHTGRALDRHAPVPMSTCGSDGRNNLTCEPTRTTSSCDDTTYFMPRFNNSSSQVTILVIQRHEGFAGHRRDLLLQQRRHASQHAATEHSGTGRPLS